MIDWHSIDTVLLDMDGTLLDLHYDDYFWLTYLPEKYAEHHRVDLRDAHQRIHAYIKKTEGSLQWYCLDHWSEVMGMDIPKLKHDIKEKIQRRPYVETFLNELKNKNIRRILVTNCHRKSLNLKIQVSGIGRWLDTIVSSHDYGIPKEQSGFWHRFIKEHPFDPTRAVFFDDNVQVLRSAKSFGIKHLVCITEPNSQKQAKDSEEFYGIGHFDQLKYA